MTTLYLLANGEYSDYSIHRAFLDKDLAQEWADMENKHQNSSYSPDDYRVEEIELTTSRPRLVTRNSISVHRLPDGTPSGIQRFAHVVVSEDPDPEVYVLENHYHLSVIGFDTAEVQEVFSAHYATWRDSETAPAKTAKATFDREAKAAAQEAGL